VRQFAAAMQLGDGSISKVVKEVTAVPTRQREHLTRQRLSLFTSPDGYVKGDRSSYRVYLEAATDGLERVGTWMSD